METLTFDSIVTLITLLMGGGGIGAILTWRYQRKKAKSEAKEAEAISEKAKFEAVQASIAATKEMQESYQRIIADMNSDRDEQREYIAEIKEDRRHLRAERDELLSRVEKVEKGQLDLRLEVARYGRTVECMRPFLCGREKCPNRTPVSISPGADLEQTLRPQTQNEIEAYNED